MCRQVGTSAVQELSEEESSDKVAIITPEYQSSSKVIWWGKSIKWSYIHQQGWGKLQRG